MRILFYGDSITDADRTREPVGPDTRLGSGFVAYAASKLYERDFEKYEVYNRGVSGNRIVDLYARVKKDCWNIQPDVLNILVGVNDIWHELQYENGVEVERFEKIYNMLLEDTKKALPNTKIIICEPFVLNGTATEENIDKFLEVKEYAKVARRLAEKFGAYYVPLQNKFDEMGERYGNSKMLADGVHPTLRGAVVLANEWLKVFDKVEAEM